MLKNLFRFERNRWLVIGFLCLSALISLSGSMLIDECRGGIGCVVVIPFYVVALPAIPLINVIKSFLSESSYSYNSLYLIPSFVQFVPVILITTYSFLLGFISARITLKIRSKNELPEERLLNTEHLNKKFLIFYPLFLIVFCGSIFITDPPVPFASSKEVTESCEFNAECLSNFIHSQVKNCNNETVFFLYPLKISLPKNDSCLFDNFTAKNPFSKYPIYQTYVVGNPSPMEIVLINFNEQFVAASDEKKVAFCNSFYHDTERSNRDFCKNKLSINQSTDTINKENCLGILLDTQYIKRDLFYDNCARALVNFKLYYPASELIPGSGENGWFYIIDEDLQVVDPSKETPQVYDFMYVSLLFSKINTQITLRQFSADSHIYKTFKNSLGAVDKYIDKYVVGSIGDDFREGQEFFERQKINKYLIDNNDVYVEYLITGSLEQLKQGGNSDNVFIQVHFIKNGTYIIITDVRNYGNPNYEEREKILLEMASSIIKQ